MPDLSEASTVVLRIGIGIIFLNSALGKFANPSGAIQLVKQLGFIPNAESFVMFLRVAEPIAGITQIIGLRVRYMCFAVAAFMCSTLLVIAAPSAKIVNGFPQLMAGGAVKDLAILGGALSLMARAPDRFTLDSKLFRLKRS